MDPSSAQPLTYGPFTGVDERNVQDDGLVAAALNVDFTAAGVSRRPGRQIVATLGTTPVVGLYRHLDKNNLVRILAVLGPTGTGEDAQHTFGLVDENAGTLTAAAAPAWVGRGSVPQRGISHANFNGHSIIAMPDGVMLDFDGTTVVRLAAMQGKDALSGLLGAKTYLASPPFASDIAVWRGRLVAIDGVTVGLSEADGALAIVPDDAPVGGPNVWPSRTWFDVITDGGDEIAGAAVLYDRLVTLGTEMIHVTDEDELEPVSMKLDQDHGCVARGSIQAVGGRVFYLAQGRICAFDGTSVTVISEAISKTMARVNWHAARGAVSAHLRQRGEYRIWLPMYGAATNSLCCIYSYRSDRWRFYAGAYPFDLSNQGNAFDVRSALVIRGGVGEEILLTGDGAGRVWREGVTETDGNATFPAYFVTHAKVPPAMRGMAGPLRAEALVDGSWIRAWMLEYGESEEVALLNRAADAEVRAKRYDLQADWGSAYVASPSPFERYDSFVLRLAVKSGPARFIVGLMGQSMAAVAEPAPGGIRRLVLDYTPANGRTP